LVGEEGAQFLLLVLVVAGWVPGDVGGGAFKEVGYENLVLSLLVCVRKDVGALQRLREEAEDIVDDEDTLFGILRTGGI